MTATLQNLEIHVAHGCNLTCESCAHFSNQGHTGMLSVEQAEEWFRNWSPRLSPQQVSLLGGEPTLNQKLPYFVNLARAHWRDARLIVVTNGFLLSRHHLELPRELAAANAELHISIHFDSMEYEAKLEPVRALVNQWEGEFGIHVRWRPSESTWTRRYHGWGAGMKPFTDQNPRSSWEHCRARWCVQLHEGQLWKCPPLAYLPMQRQRHHIGPEWDPYLAYRPLPPTCTDTELEEFVAREEESYCAMCPATPPNFLLPSPLVPIGELLKQHKP